MSEAGVTAGSRAVPDLVPARMLNEMAYCPRLFYLEWVDGEFADNYYTVHGRAVHARADEPSGKLPDPADLDEDDPLRKLRSVSLSSAQEGLIAKIDVLEVEGGQVEPVEFKRGKAAPIPERVWEPERVQLCAQGLILRAEGYTCARGWVYFAGSKERVEVVFDDALVAQTRELVVKLRSTAAKAEAPPPLENSPKCRGCSLAPICLPDEVQYMTSAGQTQAPRRLIPARDDALPLYVRGHSKRLRLAGKVVVVEAQDEEPVKARLEHTSHVCVFGGVQITTPVLRELCQREIPVLFFSYGGWFYGRTEGVGHKNVQLRIAQHRAASDASACLAIARTLVETKIANCRTLLRRNHEAAPARALADLKSSCRAASEARQLESLLGIEGTAARIYFDGFTGMLKGVAKELGTEFDALGRNRRPPRDPVNALLSFVYALLTKDCTLAAVAAGFDPYLGFYHQPRYGRPALALDLMEEFRPIIADSVVLSVLNNQVVTGKDFVRSGGSVALTESARKGVLMAYERRMDELVKHPVFGYRIGYRRVLNVQARLLARHLLGELGQPPAFRTR